MPVRKITLQEWDELNHSQPHSKRILARWVKEGRIHPTPEKVGQKWWVHPDAKYHPPNNARSAKLRQVANMINSSGAEPVITPSARVLEIFSHGSSPT